ncbi:MAG: M56 family metallopeptidase [Acidobacteriota bacterium]
MDALTLLARQWSVHLFHATWQAVAVALLLLGAVRLVPRASSTLRYALLLLALVKFAVPPMLPLPSGLFSASPAVGSSLMWAVEKYLLVSPFIVVAMLIHLAGFVVGLILIAVRQARLLRMISRSRRATADVNTIVSELAARFGVRSPRVVQSEETRVPFIAGPTRPVIVLPARAAYLRSSEPVASATGPSPAALALEGDGVMDQRDGPLRGDQNVLRDILAHEMAHLASVDLSVNWLEAILGAFYWWNPVFHLLVRQLRAAREERCDDRVLAEAVADSRGYSLSLIEAARSAGRDPFPVLGISPRRQHPLAPRVLRLSDESIQRRRRRRLLGLEVALILAASLLLLPGLHRAAHHDHTAHISHH